MIKRELVIIGGGSAGMSAAIEAYDNGVRDILIIEKNAYLGGILNQCIHNGFGLQEFKEELTGPEFMSRLADKVKERNIEVKYNSNVISINENKIVKYSNNVEGVSEIEANALVLCTGCYERNAGSIQIPGDRPSGVITAGQAQLYLNVYGYLTGKKVFILGSGDIGLIMARRMTLQGAKVIGVAEINPYSAGLNRNIVQCLKDFDIPLYLSTTVKKVIGKSHLEKIVLSKVDEHFNYIEGTEWTVDADCLLLSIGLVPDTECFKTMGFNFSKTKGAIVNQYMETSIPGVFSSGNVLHVHDLVDYVASESREAGLGASKYLKGEINHKAKVINVVANNGINYVVPQKILLDDFDSMILKFRVKKPYKDVNIFIKSGEEIIKRIYKPAIIPSEMEIVNLKKEDIAKIKHDVEVYLEEK